MAGDSKGGFVEAVTKLADRLPYADGGGRRRLVAGGIVLIGLLIVHWDGIGRSVGIKLGDGLKMSDVLKSPLLVAGCGLLVYAIGSLIELVGELFLARSAAGIFWTMSFPLRRAQQRRWFVRWPLRILLWIFVVPVLIVVHAVRGLFGSTSYRIPLVAFLTDRARVFYNSLPPNIAQGLAKPVGDDSELAVKYLLERFTDERDRKWARRLTDKPKDVLVTITAVVLIMVYGFAMSPGSVRRLSATFEELRESVSSDMERLAVGTASERRPLGAAASHLRDGLRGPKGFDASDMLERVRSIERVEGQALTTTDRAKLQELTRAVERSMREPAAMTAVTTLAEDVARVLASGTSTSITGFLREFDLRSAPPEEVANLTATMARQLYVRSRDVSTEDERKRLDALATKVEALKFASRQLAAETTLKRQAARAGVVALVAMPLLLLYVGFFFALRNSVVGLLEVLCWRQAAIPTDGDTAQMSLFADTNGTPSRPAVPVESA
jgi:hypothetical protein